MQPTRLQIDGTPIAPLKGGEGNMFAEGVQLLVGILIRGEVRRHDELPLRVFLVSASLPA
jgi:hypothetical protein